MANAVVQIALRRQQLVASRALRLLARADTDRLLFAGSVAGGVAPSGPPLAGGRRRRAALG